MKLIRKTVVQAVVAITLATGLAVAAAPTAGAAFSDCSLGPEGGSGEWCVWQGQNYTGTRNGVNYYGPYGPYYGRWSFANRFTNRCLRFYGYNNVTLAYAGSNTGNSWSSGKNVYGTGSTAC